MEQLVNVCNKLDFNLCPCSISFRRKWQRFFNFRKIANWGLNLSVNTVTTESRELYIAGKISEVCAMSAQILAFSERTKEANELEQV